MKMIILFGSVVTVDSSAEGVNMYSLNSIGFTCVLTFHDCLCVPATSLPTRSNTVQMAASYCSGRGFAYR
jgi:hypothetical protein